MIGDTYPPKSKTDYEFSLSELGFSRITYLVLHETEVFYQATTNQYSSTSRWWKKKPARTPNYLISAEAIKDIFDIFQGRSIKDIADSREKRRKHPYGSVSHESDCLIPICNRHIPSSRPDGSEPVELWGKIQNSHLLHLAAFIGESQKPVCSVHNEHFTVLWSSCAGMFEELTKE